MPLATRQSETQSVRPPSLLSRPSYLAGTFARWGNKVLLTQLPSSDALRLPHYAVLAALADFGQLAPYELANRLQVDRSHVSAYLETLTEQGLVERNPDPDDRRRLIVVLTAAGAELAAQVVTAAGHAEAECLGALSAAEQRELKRLLLKVIVSSERPIECRP